jgi:pyruvate, orthophosphate dikinase
VSADQIHDFDAPPSRRADELTRLLGGKGANLAVMAGQLALPVPPGFTISTDVCRDVVAGRWPDGLDASLQVHMERLGDRAGRRFGDPSDPLLVSVRSGAAVSMPGMMDTILNLGLNDELAGGLAAVTGDEAFAADCLRRFRDGYGAVIGADAVPDDPWEQLRTSIEAVFRSWNSDRAVAYRRREGIPDDLGTAVTVQAMVFGNRGPDSATGVLFTRNPATGEAVPYGDVLFTAQGEDVVAGDHATEPIATLDGRLPEVAAELRRHAGTLELAYRDLCDIEFTVEERRLWLLQVRVGKRSPRAALRMAIDMAEEPSFPVTRAEAVERVRPLLADPPRVFIGAADPPPPATIGLGASPGVASGTVVTDSEAAERAAAAGASVVLVRPETSPADVRGMAAAVAVLTSTGGLASHAAVVARGWGIPAVVGASAIRVLGDGIEIDGRRLEPGIELTIDGSSGAVHIGRLEGRMEVAPEAATLLGWAEELGIGLEAPPPMDADVVPPTAAAPDVGRDDVIRRLLIIGAVSVDRLAESLATDAVAIEPAIEAAVAAGHVEAVGDTLRLSAQGKLEAIALLAGDRERIGEMRAGELLDDFHTLDGRMKAVVTGWQLRDGAAEPTLNDHSDAEYDAALLGDLAVLDADTDQWLRPVSTELPRFATYRVRLERALRLARAGDGRYVASPRVDSYHGVWFELHEDLIRLAGRRRDDATDEPR